MKARFFLNVHVFILIILSFSACKSISIQNKQYITTGQKVVLGSVGQDENYILEKTYSSSAIPEFNIPVKVLATPISFNETAFKSFQNAQNFQTQDVQVNYVDSLELKPKFLNLETIDEVGLMALLNDKSNSNIKQYLVNQNESHIVTNISIVFNKKIMKDILSAEELFLESSGLKSIALNLYTNQELIKSIHFDNGVVFAYRVSKCCWRENAKYQLEIVDLVEGDNNCPKDTYLSSEKAKKEIDYYKF